MEKDTKLMRYKQYPGKRSLTIRKHSIAYLFQIVLLCAYEYMRNGISQLRDAILGNSRFRKDSPIILNSISCRTSTAVSAFKLHIKGLK